MPIVTVSQRGRLVVPAQMRRKYDLYPGTMVQIVDYGGVLAVVPVLPNPVEGAAGMLRGSTSLAERLIIDHREEAPPGR